MRPGPEHPPRHPGYWAERDPDRPAVVMGDGSASLSFGEYEAVSNQFAHLLRGLGVGRDDGVAVFMRNHALYLPLFWGAWRIGARVTAIATHLTAGELDYILADCDAKALLVSASLLSVAGEARRNGLADERVLVIDGDAAGFTPLAAALASMPSTPVADQFEGIEMLYSSGTTGRPKGVRKPLPDWDFGRPASVSYRSMARYGIDENTRYLSPAPLYHAAPLMFNLRVHRFGGMTVVMPRFDEREALSLIERHRITHSQWVPTMFVRMLRLPDAERAAFDLSSHACAIHAAAPCPVEVKQQMIDWWGPILEEYYAGSEGNGITTITSEEWRTHPGSVGRALVGTVRICDDAGAVLPAGETGTVYFADGPAFEYHNDPDKTAASRHPNGWSTLGDMGYVDEEGYLYLTDRKAFVIISGGVNIYPQEAENRLLTHPEVIDAAVFGVPDEEFGESVKAVVQLAEGVPDSDDTAARLIDWCREVLSPVKCPRSVDFIEQMPREANGKLYKRKLRDAYLA